GEISSAPSGAHDSIDLLPGMSPANFQHSFGVNHPSFPGLLELSPYQTHFYFCWLALPICQHHRVYEKYLVWLSLVYAVEIASGLVAKCGHWPESVWLRGGDRGRGSRRGTPPFGYGQNGIQLTLSGSNRAYLHQRVE